MDVTKIKRLGKCKPNVFVHIPKREFFERGGAREEKNQRENPCTKSKKQEEKEGHGFLDIFTSIMAQIPMQSYNN